MVTSDRVHENGELTVRVDHDDEAVVVSAFGELDLSNAKTLEEELRRAIGGDALEVVLDLGGVCFVDSTGLRVLLLMTKHSLRNGGRLRLVRGAPLVERAIEVAGLEDSLALAD